MDYPLLEKLYYKDKKLYEAEYLTRFNSISTIKFNIKINDSQAFVVITPELLDKIQTIHQLNNSLDHITHQLPKIALHQYIKKCLIEEIVLTNEIEGVISTRKDISEILENTSKEDKHNRLKGLVNKYNKLTDEITIRNCQDISDIYKELVWEEIKAENPENLPDGVYFRKSGVDVVSVYNKKIHEGIMPEEEINRKMAQSLDILNDDKINILIRIAIFHYLFGYIHPFYDGNGRTSRFISSCLLSKNLNILTGYRLSYTIKENISLYYKIFKISNDQKNKGDMTPFVINFLDIIVKLIENLYASVSEKYELLSYFSDVTEILSKGSSKKFDIIFILFQEMLFGSNGISVETLMKASENSQYKVRQVIKEMKMLKILKENKIGKKLFYSFDSDAVREII